jgi:GntR family transcriptional regulator
VSTPKHAQLAATLRERIALGEYVNGLPSEAALMEAHRMSRTTVRTALTTLLNEGLLRSEPGVGYFVRQLEHFIYRPQDDLDHRTVIENADSFMGAAPKRNPAQTIEVALVKAPQDVARRLNLAEGDPVVVRRRIRFLDDGVPYQLNDSYYPLDVVEGTAAMLPEDVIPGVNKLLAERGYVQTKALDEIWVRMPAPEEMHRLQLGPGTPVAEHIITGLTAGDRPVRMVRAVLPGDRNVIAFERINPDHEATATN